MRCNGRRSRILQIHPTRRCNLTCRHCYTESGPRLTEELPSRLVVGLVHEAAAEGYDYLAVSGGEPLMWRGLDSVLAAGRAAGMAVTLTTNATLVTSRRAQDLAARADYIAVSVDGTPRSHDRLRGEGAFVAMQRGVSTLLDAGVKIGLIWTLTQSNAHELADVYAYGLEIGAKFVQIHPLEGVGYARQHLLHEIPDWDELVVAGLFASDLRDGTPGAMPLYLDAASSKTLVDHVVPDSDSDGPLSALVEPLVLRSNGFVVPGNYALPLYWTLGSLNDAPLSVLVQRWRQEGLSRWRTLIEATLAELPDKEQLVNFGARLLTTAIRLPVGG